MQNSYLLTQLKKTKSIYEKGGTLYYTEHGAQNVELTGEWVKAQAVDLIDGPDGKKYSFLKFLDLLKELYDSKESLIPTSNAKASTSVFFREILNRVCGSTLFMNSLEFQNNEIDVKKSFEDLVNNVDFSVAGNVKDNRKVVLYVLSFAKEVNKLKQLAQNDTKILLDSLIDSIQIENFLYLGNVAKQQFDFDGRSTDAVTFLFNNKDKEQFKDALDDEDKDLIYSVMAKIVTFRRNCAVKKMEYADKVLKIYEEMVLDSELVSLKIKISLAQEILEAIETSSQNTRVYGSNRQDTNIRKNVQNTIRLAKANSPEEFDYFVPETPEGLNGLLNEIKSRIKTGQIESQGDPIKISSKAFDIRKKQIYMEADANTFADSLTLGAEKPVDVPRELVVLVYNNFLLGGAEMSALVAKNLKSVKGNLINDFKKYFAQKTFNNFVDFCGYVGITNNIEEKYKLLNFFFRIGKKESAASQGDSAKTPLFPVRPIALIKDKTTKEEQPINNTEIVFIKMGDISLDIVGENEFEGKFDHALKKAVLSVGGTARVEIEDSLGHKQILEGVTANGIFLSSSGKDLEMRKNARTDVKIEGSGKSFYVSLKKSREFSYWGGLSGERREQKLGRADLSSLTDKRSIEADAAFYEKSITKALAMTLPEIAKVMKEKYPTIRKEIALPSKASTKDFVQGLKGYFLMKKMKKEPISQEILELAQEFSSSLYGIDEELRINTKNIILKDIKSRVEEKFLGFWSMMYQYETIIRQMLFGEKSEIRKAFPEAESVSHIIVGMPSIIEDKKKKRVVVQANEESFIVANKEFLLHNPVGNKSQETGLSLNKDLFAGAMPIFLSSEKNKENTAGVERLYTRAAPLSTIVKKGDRSTVFQTALSILRKGTAADFKAQLKSISEFLVSQDLTPGYFRMEKDTVSEDTKSFLRNFNQTSSVEVDFIYDVYITVGEGLKDKQIATVEGKLVLLPKSKLSPLKEGAMPAYAEEEEAQEQEALGGPTSATSEIDAEKSLSSVKSSVVSLKSSIEKIAQTSAEEISKKLIAFMENETITYGVGSKDAADIFSGFTASVKVVNIKTNF